MLDNKSDTDSQAASTQPLEKAATDMVGLNATGIVESVANMSIGQYVTYCLDIAHSLELERLSRELGLIPQRFGPQQVRIAEETVKAQQEQLSALHRRAKAVLRAGGII